MTVKNTEKYDSSRFLLLPAVSARMTDYCLPDAYRTYSASGLRNARKADACIRVEGPAAGQGRSRNLLGHRHAVLRADGDQERHPQLRLPVPQCPARKPADDVGGPDRREQ